MHPAWAAQSNLAPPAGSPSPLSPAQPRSPQSPLRRPDSKSPPPPLAPHIPLLQSPPFCFSAAASPQPTERPGRPAPAPRPRLCPRPPPAPQPAPRGAPLPVRPVGVEARRGGKRSRGVGGQRHRQSRGGLERGDVEGGTEPGQRRTRPRTPGRAQRAPGAARRTRRGAAPVVSSRPCTERPPPQPTSRRAEGTAAAGPRSPNPS